MHHEIKPNTMIILRKMIELLWASLFSFSYMEYWLDNLMFSNICICKDLNTHIYTYRNDIQENMTENIIDSYSLL